MLDLNVSRGLVAGSRVAPQRACGPRVRPGNGGERAAVDGDDDAAAGDGVAAVQDPALHYGGRLVPGAALARGELRHRVTHPNTRGGETRP